MRTTFKLSEQTYCSFYQHESHRLYPGNMSGYPGQHVRLSRTTCSAIPDKLSGASGQKCPKLNWSSNIR